MKETENLKAKLTTPNNLRLNATDFAALPVTELREIIGQCLRNMADNLVTLARAVQAAEAQGDDLSDLRIDLLPKLRLIACGQLLPEVLTRGWKQPLVQFVSRLPITEQRRLVDGGTIPVIVCDGSGNVTDSNYGIFEVYALKDFRKRVFARDHIRTLPEQRAILDAQRTGAKIAKPEMIDGGRIDRENDGVWDRRKLIPATTLKKWLKALEQK